MHGGRDLHNMARGSDAGVAQLVEHPICNRAVGSSSLSASTTSPLRMRASDSKILICCRISYLLRINMHSDKINRLLGYNLSYEYKVLEELPDAFIKKYISRIREKFSRVAKSFDDDENTKWFIRNYLALKYILAATVLGTSAQYAKEHNLKIMLPYLNYYMMLNCCHSFIFSCPYFEWKGIKSITMKHKTIINTASEKISNIDKNRGAEIKSQLKEAKFQRELFSYRFPAQGFFTSNFQSDDLEQSIKTSQLFADLTQLNSACLEASVDKHGSPPFCYNKDEIIKHISRYEENEEKVFDGDDDYRAKYFMRKTDKPYSIYSLATEGLTEDFFGAWVSEDEAAENGVYDPDDNWFLLIPLR